LPPTAAPPPSTCDPTEATGGQVILDIPARPVMEGSDVTLFCKTKDGYRQPADFYRNNTFITAAPETGFTISPVQQSDEGFYRCDVGYVGRSAESWLSVRGQDPHFHFLFISHDSYYITDVF
uniref:Ig-like domain-containing protein n=1 Tax=Myripristis murdjan TaxID=586833 RepID=A0A667ZDC3_9TELE